MINSTTVTTVTPTTRRDAIRAYHADMAIVHADALADAAPAAFHRAMRCMHAVTDSLPREMAHRGTVTRQLLASPLLRG